MLNGKRGKKAKLIETCFYSGPPSLYHFTRSTNKRYQKYQNFDGITFFGILAILAGVGVKVRRVVRTVCTA